MAKSKIDWLPILESEDDIGKITSYGTKFKGKFYWISEQPDGKWCIEIKGLTGEIYPLKEGLMSLTSAKRYFSRYIKS